MAEFEGNLNLNVETSEIEIKGKFKLTEDELDVVAGGKPEPASITDAVIGGSVWAQDDDLFWRWGIVRAINPPRITVEFGGGSVTYFGQEHTLHPVTLTTSEFYLSSW